MHIYEELTLVPSIETAAISTNTTTNGADHDRAPAASAAFQEVLFYIDAGAYTDGTYVFGIEEADDDGAGSPDTYADAIAAVVLGGTAGANELTVSDNSLQNSQFYLGYKGAKQWVRLAIVSTGVTTGWAEVEAHAVLGGADDLPLR